MRGELIAKSEEHRVSSAVMYEPDAPDAHDEWIARDELKAALIDYCKRADKTLRLQHQAGTSIGDVTAIVVWPDAIPAKLCVPTRGCATKRLNPGTSFALTRWSPEAWSLVRAGTLRGLSLGGSAIRVPDQEPTAKAKDDCGCGGACRERDDLAERARARLARGLIGW